MVHTQVPQKATAARSSAGTIAGSFVLVSVACLMAAWRACQTFPRASPTFVRGGRPRDEGPAVQARRRSPRLLLHRRVGQAPGRLRAAGGPPSTGWSKPGCSNGPTGPSTSQIRRACSERALTADSTGTSTTPSPTRSVGAGVDRYPTPHPPGPGRRGQASPHRHCVGDLAPLPLPTTWWLRGLGAGQGLLDRTSLRRQLASGQGRSARTHHLAWIVPDPSDQLTENRHGRAFRIDLAWAAPRGFEPGPALRLKVAKSRLETTNQPSWMVAL